MRWLFLDPPRPSDSSLRDDVIRRIDQWWRDFKTAVPGLVGRFESGEHFDVVGLMHRHLGAVHPDLMWEFGRGSKTGHRLTITPEANHGLRPMVSSLLERAPTLKGWEFLDHRPADPELLRPTLEQRCGFAGDEPLVRIEPGKGNRVNVTYTISDDIDPDDAMRVAYVATETLLGEPNLDRWVGWIDRVSAPSGAGWHPASQAPTHFENAKRALLASLPTQPRALLRDAAPWTALEVSVDKQDDYPRRDDMFIATTMDVTALQTYCSGMNFCSERFSRLGEIFCYLKLERGASYSSDPTAFRAPIEDAVHGALVGAGLGAHIGGGTGIRYSYVDLVLTNVSAAVPVIRSALSGSPIGERSWLLFCDYHLCSEWVGLTATTPPPPHENS